MEKDWPKRPSNHQLQEAGKKTLIRPQLLRWRQSMSLHTWCHQGPCKPSSCANFMLNPQWSRATTGKKKNSCVYALRVVSLMSNSLQPCRLWLGSFLCRGGSPGKNTGVYWPILVATLLQSTVFPVALASNSPEYLVLPEPLGPKQLHYLHTWPSQEQTQVLQGSLRSKPQWKTHMQR